MGRRSEIDILASFDTDTPRSTAEIVAATGLPRSTTFRALRVLAQAGLLQQDPKAKRYSLGTRMLQLGHIARRQLSPEDLASPALLRLTETTQETVAFNVVDIPWRLCVYAVDSPSDLRYGGQPGSRYPLHVGGSSNVILANLPHDIATGVLRYHGVEPDEIPVLLDRLQEVRDSGVAVSVGQRVAGASSVAAPVFLGDEIFGSVAVGGPSDRLGPRIDEYRPLVKQAAAEISERLTAR